MPDDSSRHSPSPTQPIIPGWLNAIVILTLFAAGLVLRLAYLRTHYIISPEAAIIARELTSSFRTILGIEIPIVALSLMAALMKAGAMLLGGFGSRNVETVAHWISLVSGLLVILPLGSLARKWSGSPVASWVAIGLYLLNDRLIAFMTGGDTESLTTFVYISAIWFGWKAIETNRARWAFLAGIVSILAVFTRHEITWFAPAFSVVLVGVLLVKKQKASIVLGIPAALMLGWILCLSPSLIDAPKVGSVNPPPVVRESLNDCWYTAFSEQLSRERAYYEEIPASLLPRNVNTPYDNPSILMTQPNALARVYLHNLPQVVTIITRSIKSWGIILLLLGIIALMRAKDGKFALWVAAASMVPLFIIPKYVFQEGNLTPYVAILQIIIGCGIGWIADGILSKTHRGFTHVVASFLIAAIILSGLAIHGKRAWKEAKTPGDIAWEHRAMGYYILDNLPEVSGSLLLTNAPYVPFYAGDKNYSFMPYYKSVDDLKKYCEKQKVGYLVLDSRLIKRLYPSYAPLLDPANAPDWLAPVVVLPTNPSIVLYRINESPVKN